MKTKPTAILTADVHIHSTVPLCRTDEFFPAQWRKLQWLSQLQEKYGCPILDAGDVVENWKTPPSIERMAMRLLPKDFYTVPGNHDLPNHSLQLLEQSSLSVLWEACRLNVLLSPLFLPDFSIHPFPWGAELRPFRTRNKTVPAVAICHVMTYQGENPWPGATCPDADSLLARMRGYDLVLTGHNHKTFIERDGDRLLVNPGSLMRTKADQIDHKPVVWLWYAETNEVEPVYVPIEAGVVSREHIERKQEKDNRMAAYVEMLNGDYDISDRFETNLEAFFDSNRVRSSVQEIVMECVGN